MYTYNLNKWDPTSWSFENVTLLFAFCKILLFLTQIKVILSHHQNILLLISYTMYPSESSLMTLRQTLVSMPSALLKYQIWPVIASYKTNKIIGDFRALSKTFTAITPAFKVFWKCCLFKLGITFKLWNYEFLICVWTRKMCYSTWAKTGAAWEGGIRSTWNRRPKVQFYAGVRRGRRRAIELGSVHLGLRNWYLSHTMESRMTRCNVDHMLIIFRKEMN